MRWMVRVESVLQIIPNIKVTKHNQNVSNIGFSILKILQSWLKRVRINVHHIESIIIVEEWNKQNISVIKKVFVK